MNLRSKIKKNMNPWLYKGQVFNDDMIPEDAIGFVYEMEAIINDKPVRYLGKKNFFSIRKKKFGKRALAKIKDKRTKKYEIIKNLNYQNYYSSNTILKDAHKAGTPIKRFIIHICYSKISLTYYETKMQFLRDVLEDSRYLNGNILGKFYKGKIK